MACMGSINCPGKVCCLEPGDGGAMGGGGGFGGGAVEIRCAKARVPPQACRSA